MQAWGCCVFLVTLAAGAEGAARLVRLEPLTVLLDVALPLLGDVILEVDRVHRAYGLAGGAIDAGVWVDVVLLVVFAAVDAIDGADVDAALVLGADAGFRDDVRQSFVSRPGGRCAYFSRC